MNYWDKVRDYYKQNPDEYENICQRRNLRYKYDSHVNALIRAISKNNINDSLKALKIIGCSAQRFQKHFESLFTEEMNWNNKGKDVWVLHHIKPCAGFDLTQESEVKKCYYFKNIVPMNPRMHRIRHPKRVYMVKISIGRNNGNTIDNDRTRFSP